MNAEEVIQEVERSAREYADEQGDQDAYYPAMTGFLRAQVSHLVRRCNELERQARRSGEEQARLQEVERCANWLLDEFERAGRNAPRYGPATTAEIEDATEALREALQEAE
jgi:hypothetical protein